jgi:hypothetical protein
MGWAMHDKEFESVLSLSGSERYAYFVKKAADWEEIWSLKTEDGWVLAGDDQGNELVPIWPHQRFAIACATGNWRGSEPAPIELSVYLERWIPGMLRDRRLAAVFPTPTDKGVVVTPERLREDLEAELSLYE